MAGISAKIVKALRDQTGAGMMDCKKALTETDGDVSKAVEWLRQKGISSAEKKSGKVAAEGLVGQYIHTGGRVGVLVEVNCQTDFVARNEAFQELVRNVAMQIAACPNVEFISTNEIPDSVVERERKIEMGREDLASKPENIRGKIVDGRIGKRLGELALMNQPYIRDQSITVEDLVKQTSGDLGEKIEVRRFARFVLGEGIEKKEDDFVAEVAAQAAAAKAKTEQAEAVKQESQVEEPKVEEPKVEEPKAEEAKVEEPQAEELQAEESKVEEPKTEEPKAGKTKAKSSKGGFSKKGGKKKGGSKKKGSGK